MSKHQIKCLFGYHKYTTPHEKYINILICENCKRAGYRSYTKNFKKWYDFDEKGTMTHWKNSNGYERWFTYDANGRSLLCKDSNGHVWEYDESCRIWRGLNYEDRKREKQKMKEVNSG